MKMMQTVILLMVAALPGYGEETSATVVNCAACRYASWPHDAWECDVKCNVAPTGVLTYGSVDAFAAVLGPRASHNQDVTTDEIFIFDVINVNIRGGYNSTTGKFTVSVAGVYKVGLYVFAAYSSEGKLNLMMKKTDENEEKHVCAAHANANSFRGGSCGTLLQLEEGDELYAKGFDSGFLYTPSGGQVFCSMEAYMLYKATT